jgi:hypothetical protein
LECAIGYGDEIIGSGIARGAAARGRRIAFGDGEQVIWSQEAHEIYRGNPNVARPGASIGRDVEWVRHFPGERAYGLRSEDRMIYDPAFRARPGELFFSDEELKAAEAVGPADIVIEPAVKLSAENKWWPFSRYRALARRLARAGHPIVQFDHSGIGRDLLGLRRQVLPGARLLPTPTFRIAAAMLARARLYIGPEGGLHHAAAAAMRPAVVIFGGLTHPRTTGYDFHVNIFRGGEACGNHFRPCPHCRAALAGITVDEVHDAATLKLNEPERLIAPALADATANQAENAACRV